MKTQRKYNIPNRKEKRLIVRMSAEQYARMKELSKIEKTKISQLTRNAVDILLERNLISPK